MEGGVGDLPGLWPQQPKQCPPRSLHAGQRASSGGAEGWSPPQEGCSQSQRARPGPLFLTHREGCASGCHGHCGVSGGGGAAQWVRSFTGSGMSFIREKACPFHWKCGRR